MFTIKKLKIILTLLLGILIVSNSAKTVQERQWWEDIQGQITLGKKEFLLGEPIYIRVVVTNKGNETVNVGDPIYNCFEFSADGSPGKPVKKLKNPDISGSFRTIPVAPGTTFDGVAFINEYLDFPGPGVYTVTCDGCILVHKGLAKDQDRSIQSISIKGVVTLKLRRGSVAEQEDVLRKYLAHLKSDDRRLQSQASHAFTVSESSLAVKLLKEALMEKGDPRPSYASRATWALAKIGTEQAVQALSNVALHSEKNGARVAAIIQLGSSRIIESVPTLREVLSDPSANIRVAALNSLGKIGDKSSIPEVESRLNDSDEGVRDVASKVYKLLNEGIDKNSDKK